MKKILIVLCSLVLLASSAYAGASSGSTAQNETSSTGNLLFILDASGSMWGRVDGKPKIVVAKDVMSQLVQELPDNAKVGLMAYGHRRKGDCLDIQSLVALGPLDRDAMIKKIQSLNAKGKTPLTASVKQAVELLRQEEASASIVLVSDGLESCGGDPCEAVKAAKRSGVNFTLHVVGFDLADADTSQLQCMADAGGGQFVTAANADELTEALEQVVQAKPSLTLEVTGNGERTPAQVVIFKAGTHDQVSKSDIGTSPDGNPANPQQITLAAGQYDVRVTPNKIQGAEAKTLEGVTVPEKGTVERSVDFSASQLKIHVTANGKLQQARIHVFRAGDDKHELARIDVDGGPKPYHPNPGSKRLQPGDYDLRITPHAIEAPEQWLRDVHIQAGETVEKSVDFSPGKLEVHVTANNQSQDARIHIFRAGDDKHELARIDVDGGPKPYHPNPGNKRLQPGDYDLRITANYITTPDKWLRGVHVVAGETVAKSVNFDSGKLTVHVTANDKSQDGRIHIYPAGDSKHEIARIDVDGGPKPYHPNPGSKRLQPGDYDLRITANNITTPDKWLRGVRVADGETVTKSVNFDSGKITVHVTSNGKSQDARIHIFNADDSKHELARIDVDGGPKPYHPNPGSKRLQPGDYDLRITANGIKAAEKWLRGIHVAADQNVEKSVDFDTDG